MKTKLIVDLAKLALRFGEVKRATFHPDGVTPESDTTHTVMLGLIACTVAADIGYDESKAAQFALVHDLVEANCGDTNTAFITAEGREEKAKRERVARRELMQEFGAATWVMCWLERYEEQEEPEARLVRYLDKVLPKITHMFNGCITVKAMGRSRQDLIDAHDRQLKSLNEQYPELREALGPLFADLAIRCENAW